MNETSKAMRRRWCEAEQGIFPWKKIFQGRGIDIGCGPDKLPFDACEAFDKEQGDANRLSEYFPPDSFDYLHSSQSLEHMANPRAALKEWMKVVRPGGFVIVAVPSWELYEGMQWPSRYNPDHKATFSMSLRGSPAPIHILLPDFLQELNATTLLCRLVDANYDYKVGTTKDQTWDESDGVEAFIEMVIQKA
jgi:SAM-dependent methyltransferase